MSTNKEKLWNANYVKVMTTNFLLYFAFYLLTPLLPLYLSETFGATKDTSGIVLTAIPWQLSSSDHSVDM